jgi:hypothetical protein
MACGHAEFHGTDVGKVDWLKVNRVAWIFAPLFLHGAIQKSFLLTSTLIRLHPLSESIEEKILLSPWSLWFMC